MNLTIEWTHRVIKHSPPSPVRPTPQKPSLFQHLAFVTVAGFGLVCFDGRPCALLIIGDEKLLNPTEAVRLAERACELTDYKQPGMLDTLGVAYAAAGRFTEAIETAEKAIGLAREAKQAELIEDMESHLQLYKKNKPYRD